MCQCAEIACIRIPPSSKPRAADAIRPVSPPLRVLHLHQSEIQCYLIAAASSPRYDSRCCRRRRHRYLELQLCLVEMLQLRPVKSFLVAAACLPTRRYRLYDICAVGADSRGPEMLHLLNKVERLGWISFGRFYGRQTEQEVGGCQDCDLGMFECQPLRHESPPQAFGSRPPRPCTTFNTSALP